MKYYVAF